MCGIGGVFNADRQQTVDRQLLVNMAAIQAHRGPDGFGVEVLDQAGVGFCHALFAFGRRLRNFAVDLER